MARAFFEQVTDLLVGFLPPRLRTFEHQSHARACQVWFTQRAVHYEVQLIGRGPLRAAGIADMTEALEVGLHVEHPDPARNDEVLDHLARARKTWRAALGSEATPGPFVGRREHAARWRRLSELWPGPGLDTDEAAVEAAERLATYIRALEPLLAARAGAGGKG